MFSYLYEYSDVFWSECKKSHCLISNTEHLVAKIQSVKFSVLLSIVLCNRRAISEGQMCNYFPNMIFYVMLSGRILTNIGENIFRSYTDTTSDSTDFHVLVAYVNCACLTTR